MSDVIDDRIDELQLDVNLLESNQKTTHTILCGLVENESERVAKAVADAMGPVLSRLDSLESENTRLKAEVAALKSGAATVPVPVQAFGAPRAPPPAPKLPLPGSGSSPPPPPPPPPGSPPDSVEAAPDSVEAAPEVVAQGEGGVVVDPFKITLIEGKIKTLQDKVKVLEGRGSDTFYSTVTQQSTPKAQAREQSENAVAMHAELQKKLASRRNATNDNRVDSNDFE